MIEVAGNKPGISFGSVAIMVIGIGSLVFITAKIKRKVDEIN